MNQYDINVNKVMDFLKVNNYGSTSKHLHKACYKNFKSYLEDNKLIYSFENAQNWLRINHKDWSYRRYTGYKHCLNQLEDICKHKCISLNNIASQVSDYVLLTLGGKIVVVEND